MINKVNIWMEIWFLQGDNGGSSNNGGPSNNGGSKDNDDGIEIRDPDVSGDYDDHGGGL